MQGKEELEFLDPVHSEDQMTAGNLREGLSLIEKAKVSSSYKANLRQNGDLVLQCAVQFCPLGAGDRKGPDKLDLNGFKSPSLDTLVPRGPVDLLCPGEFRFFCNSKKQRSAFDQVSKFDRGRIVAYRDCGLSFREIGSRVGRNQTTVMRIRDRWMPEGTMDRRGRSHSPQCPTSRENRQTVRMAVTDRSVTSQTVAQHIESVTHHSVSARAIRRSLQQSGLTAKRPLLGLPLTQNHICLHRQWCDERRMWVAEWNEVVFTDESRSCLPHHDGRIRVWRQRGERMLNSCVMHLHTGPAPGIML
ncbi:transposable element Tcb1 transposase [Trichonephila clavipes]|nr:transposable element Tcb1 transposase [Trichonephila clavipes]